jgi:hypothetical protein
MATANPDPLVTTQQALSEARGAHAPRLVPGVPVAIRGLIR